MSVRLETDGDRHLEGIAISRIVAAAPEGTRHVQMPDLSAIDYVLTLADRVTHGIEIKTRKESVDQIRGYGGLMLKHRKLTEIARISELLRVRCFVAFAFNDAQGPILIAEPSRILDLEPVTPPPRRNYRGLPCDEEPVVYLDWDRHLARVT
jgi:hypothetical protein